MKRPAAKGTFSMTSEAGELVRLRNGCARSSKGTAVPRPDQSNLLLAVGELCNNSIQHGLRRPVRRHSALAPRYARRRRLAEVLDSWSAPRRWLARRRGWLAGLAFVGVLDRVVAELADGQEEVRLVGPRHAVPFELLAQPFRSRTSSPASLVMEKVPLAAGRFIRTVTLLARLRG